MHVPARPAAATGTFVAVVVDIDIEPVDVIRCSNRHEKQYESKVKYAHSIALPR